MLQVRRYLGLVYRVSQFELAEHIDEFVFPMCAFIGAGMLGAPFAGLRRGPGIDSALTDLQRDVAATVQ